MEILLGLIFLTLSIGGGFILIYGTWRGWPCLINPPEKFALVYSLAFIKKYLGATSLRFHNYVLGILFIIVGLVMLWNELFRN